MAIKYTIFVILMIKLEFKLQQQYIQGFFKKKPCQRQAEAVQCRSEPIHQAGASRPAN